MLGGPTVGNAGKEPDAAQMPKLTKRFSIGLLNTNGDRGERSKE